MKIGKTIEIGGIVWNILFQKDLKNPETGEEITHGYTDDLLSEIRINQDLRPQGRILTLLHEIRHIISDSMGLHGQIEVNPHLECMIEFESLLWLQVIKQIMEWQK